MSKQKLEVTKITSSGHLATMKIAGFADGELDELKNMGHYDARAKLLDMLDERNGGTGTMWKCGYGVYGVWFDNEFAYANIGQSCD